MLFPIDHPEIEEFIEMRRPTGGDTNRRSLNLHHGVLVSDAFMRAVETDGQWALEVQRWFYTSNSFSKKFMDKIVNCKS